MKQFKRTLVAVFSVLFLLATALFVVGCDSGSTAQKPGSDPSGSLKPAYSVFVDVNDEALGDYSISATNVDGKYEEGSPVTISVTPQEGYEAVLTINGEAVELIDNAYTFAISSDTSVKLDYTYLYTVSSFVYAGKAEVTYSAPANGSLYQENEEVTVTVQPEEGLTVASIKRNGAAQDFTYDAKNGTYSFKFNIKERSYITVTCAEACDVSIKNDDAKGTLSVNGTVCANGSVLHVKAGDTLTLSVTLKGGNTLEGIYAGDAMVPLSGNAGTVTVRKAMELEVVYNTFYTVTLPAAGTLENGNLSLDKQPSSLGYEAGTVLVLTVTPAQGYVLRSLIMTENGVATDITKTAARGKYSFPVNGNISFEATFSSPVVSISYNNSNFGTAVLSGAEAISGDLYLFGAELTLTMTPNEGFVFGFLSVNGEMVSVQKQGESEVYTYSFTVEGDVDLYVCFEATDFYRVALSAGGLKAYGITATLGNYIGYDGEAVSVSVDYGESELPAGKGLFFSTGGARQLVAGERFTAVIDGKDLTITLFVADLIKPVITFTEGSYDYDVVLSGGNYVVTLHDPADSGESHFTQWIVMLGGKPVTLTADAEAKTHSFTLPYDETAGAMNVLITANWGDLISMKFSSDANGTLSLADGYYEAGNVTFTVTPKEGYRVKSVTYVSDASGAALKTSTFNTLGTVTETYALTVDTTVRVTYQKIFTIAFALAESDANTAAFEVTVSDGAFSVKSTTANVWTLDEGSTYTFKVTANANYNVKSVKIGGSELVTSSANTFTSGSRTLSEDVRVEVRTVAFVAVSWTVIGPVDVTVKNGATALASGDKVEKGTRLTLTVTMKANNAATDYVITVTANGQSVTAANNAYAIDATAATEIAVTAAKILSETFPAAPSTSGPSQTESAPTQGTWTSMNEASEDELVFTEHTLVIGADPVKTIVTTTNADPGKVEYTLTTEGNKTYTLSWFNDTAGYILELAENSAAAARIAVRANGPRYYLNPNLAEDLLKAASVEALNGTWKADDKALTIGAADGKMTLGIGDSSAKYIIKVTDELYFVILGDDLLPHVMKYTDGVFTFDGTPYTKQTEEVEKTITGYGAANLILFGSDGLRVSIRIITDDYTAEEIYANFKLQIADNLYSCSEQVGKESNNNIFIAYYLITSGTSVTNLNTGSYQISLVVDGKVESECPLNGLAEHVVKLNGRDYEISLKDGKFMLTIAESLTEYTVTLNVVDLPNGAVQPTLKNGETVVESGSKVPANASLTLTVPAVENYTVTVNIDHGNAVENADNTYTITLADNATITVTYVAQGSRTITIDDVFLQKIGDEPNAIPRLEFKISSTYTESEMQSGKVYYGETTSLSAYVGTVQNLLFVNLADLTSSDEEIVYTFIKIEIAGDTHTIDFEKDLNVTITVNNIDYTLGNDGNKVTVTVKNHGSGTEPEKTPKLTFAEAAILEVEGLYIIVTTENVESLDAAKNAIKLCFDGGNEVGPDDKSIATADAGKYKLHFTFPASLEASQSYVLTVQAYATTLGLTANSNTSNTFSKDNKTYALKVEGDELILTVTAASAKFTVTVTEEGKPASGGGYELKNGDATVASGAEVDANTSLTLTVTVPEGYTVSVSVNGTQLTATSGNTYTFTVTAATTVTITYTQTTTPTPEPEISITEFVNANVVSDNNDTSFQIILRFKAQSDTMNGEAILQALEKDLLLCIGEAEGLKAFTTQYDGGGQIFLFFYRVDGSSLSGIAAGQSAEVTVRSTLLNKTFTAPANSVDTNQKSAVLNGGQDSYTLALEGDGESRKLVLQYEKAETVEKKVSFAGTSFYLGADIIRIALNVTLEGYTDEEKTAAIRASSLTIGGLTFEIKEYPDAWYYWIAGVEGQPSVTKLSNGTYDVILKFDGKQYSFPTVQNGVGNGPITFEDKIYTLSAANEKLTLTIADKPTEFVVNVEVSNKPDGVSGLGYELTKGNATFTSGSTLSASETLNLKVTPSEGLRVVVSVTGATLTEVGENQYTISQPTDTVTIKIEYRDASEPLGTVSSYHAGQLWTNDLDITIIIGFFTKGYTVSQVRSATLKIGEFTCTRYEAGAVGETAGDGLLKHLLWFYINDVQNITDEKVYLVIEGEQHEIILDSFTEASQDFHEKHYTLKLDADKQFSLTVTSQAQGDNAGKSGGTELKGTLQNGASMTFTATAAADGADIDIIISSTGSNATLLTLHLFTFQAMDMEEPELYTGAGGNQWGPQQYTFYITEEPPAIVSNGDAISIKISLAAGTLSLEFTVGGQTYNLSIMSFGDSVNIEFVPTSLSNPTLS